MAEPTIAIDPAELSPTELYGLLVSAVVPRPIALVSTISAAGYPNLAPFSFFMAGGSTPPSLAFSPTAGRDGIEKDTLRNIEETGEFVVGVVDREMALGMNEAGFAYPKDEDEWPATGLTPLPSEAVRPARVAESPVQFECRLFQIVRHGEGRGAARYVIGEVVRIHVSRDLWNPEDGLRERLALVGRLDASRYIDLGLPEIFEMARPTAPSASSGSKNPGVQ